MVRIPAGYSCLHSKVSFYNDIGREFLRFKSRTATAVRKSTYWVRRRVHCTLSTQLTHILKCRTRLNLNRLGPPLERQNVLQISQVLFRCLCVGPMVVLPFKDSQGGTWLLNLI
jgi:hypothetical protein